MNVAEKASRSFSSRLVEPTASLLLVRLSHFLIRQNIRAYVVGGLVRDTLLNRATADIDIAVAGDALEVASRVADALGGRYVLLDELNRVGRVVTADYELDFSSFTGSIEQDLERRDLTLNAMAVELGQFSQGLGDIRVIDPFNGWDDLHQGIIRVVTPTAFKTDAVRLLRTVRLAYELGFSIDSQTEALVQRYCSSITSVAGERIREELLRLLAVPQTEGGLRYLDKVGLLTSIIPELAQEKGVEQPKEHSWDVFNHSLKTVSAVNFLLRRGDWGYTDQSVLAEVPWSSALSEHFNLEVSSGSSRGLLLKLAALLHDIAKPQTRTIDASGRMRFLGHALEGAVVAASIMKRLRFSTKEIKLVEAMVEHHLRPTQLSQSGLPSRRAIYRYFRDTGEAGIDVLLLSLADHLAARGSHLDLDEWRGHVQTVNYVLAKHLEPEGVIAPHMLVNGNDLITVLGMKPGPEIGELLEAVREAQASGEIETREEALAYIRRHWLKRGSREPKE